MYYEILKHENLKVTVRYVFEDGTDVEVKLSVKPIAIGEHPITKQMMFQDPLMDLEQYILAHGEAHWRGLLQERWRAQRLNDAVRGLIGTTVELPPAEFLPPEHHTI